MASYNETIDGNVIDITSARHYRARLFYTVTTDDDTVSITYQTVVQMKTAYDYPMEVEASYTTASGGSSSKSSSGSATAAEYEAAGSNWFTAEATRIKWTVNYPRESYDYYVECSVDVSCYSYGTSTAEDSILIPAVDLVTVYVSDWDNTAGETIRSKWDSAQFTPGESVDAGSYWGTEPPSDIYEYVDSDECIASEGAIAWRNFRQKDVTVYVSDYCIDTGEYIREQWASTTVAPGTPVDGSLWGTDPPSEEYEFYSFDPSTEAYDGLTVDRNFTYRQVSVNCEDMTIYGESLGSAGAAKSYKYNTHVYGSAWGDNTTVGIYHTGYSYTSCSDDYAVDGLTLYRYFTPAQYDVTVHDVIGDQTGRELGNLTVQLEYDLEVYGSEISSATYPGYNYVSDTSIRVQTSNNNVYRIFEPQTYYLQYELGPGQEDEPLPRSATYDEWFKIPDPVRLGYELAGWQMQGMSNDTHYHSPDASATRVEFFGPDADCVYGPYFMNLSSEEGTIYCNAIWKAKGLGRIYIPDDPQHPYHSALCFIYHTDETTGEGKYWQCIPYIYNNGTYRIGG